MSSRSSSEFGSLSERIDRSAVRVNRTADGSAPNSDNRTASTHARTTAKPSDAFQHVWVIVEPGRRVPGVLTQWSHGAEGWRGRVLFAWDADTVAWRWLAADQLEPADRRN